MKDFLRDGRDQPLTDLEEQIVDQFRTIYDPEIPVPIWDLGLIYGLDVDETDPEGARVHVLMTLTAPNCPAAEVLPAEARRKVVDLDGVADCEVEITFTPTFTLDMVSEEAKLTLGLL